MTNDRINYLTVIVLARNYRTLYNGLNTPGVFPLACIKRGRMVRRIFLCKTVAAATQRKNRK